MHTSPLAQPGAGDGGGMNVYVRALASALARAGVECDVYTRAEDHRQARVVEVEPGFRVVHVEAGPRAVVARSELPDLVDAFLDETTRLLDAGPPVDVLHANYWLSGAVAHRLKHLRDLPLVATFHTLARVKADAGVDDDPDLRARTEHEVIACADLMLASTDSERDQLAIHYGAVAERVEIVPPGVDHSVFFPADAGVAKRRLGFEGRRMLLFAGRIQLLKGVDMAVRCLAELDDPTAMLLVVGGPSGPDGAAELARVRALAHDLGIAPNVRFVPPQPHDAARRLLPCRRRVHRSVTRRVVRSRRARGRGLRNPGGRRVGRRSAVARRTRHDGLSGRRSETRRVCRSRLEASRRSRRSPPRSARPRRCIRGATRGASPPRRLRRLYGDLVARGLVRCD